jgi:hypothetical protein
LERRPALGRQAERNRARRARQTSTAPPAFGRRLRARFARALGLPTVFTVVHSNSQKRKRSKKKKGPADDGYLSFGNILN